MAGASILIVDDDKHVRAVLHDMLTEVGYQVGTAPDGHTALREAESNQFDLVLIDVHMPDPDGVQVLRELQTVAPDSRCVMISGVQDPELAETCRRLGAQGFLGKPIRLTEVTALIDELVPPATRRPPTEQPLAEAEPPLPQEPAVAAEPEPPVPEPTEPADALPRGARLRDPAALFRSRENGEVLCRFACTVHAELDAGGRSADEWHGRVEDFHLAPSGEAAAAESLPGTLLLRDGIRGPFAGDALLCGNELVAEGPLARVAPRRPEICSATARKSAKDPSVTIIDLSGDLSGEQVHHFTDALREAIRTGRRRIVVHLDGVSFLDSSAVKACLWVLPQLRGRNGDLRIAGARGDIWRILETLGAHRSVCCFATESDAVASFSA
ncbi:MAG: response regulator [Armatimonadota bacterium]|jgi:anti-anti-sigma factor